MFDFIECSCVIFMLQPFKMKYFKKILKNWAPKNNLRKTSLFSIINIHQLRQKIHGLGGLQNQLITQRSYAEYAASVANAIQ